MTSPNPTTTRLYNKVAIVTGAASGFGLAITELLAFHGCSVVAADLNSEALYSHFSADSARQPASARVDGRVVGIVADVAGREGWDLVVKTARERYGGLDVVVNNAGTSYRNKVSLELVSGGWVRWLLCDGVLVLRVRVVWSMLTCFSRP